MEGLLHAEQLLAGCVAQGVGALPGRAGAPLYCAAGSGRNGQPRRQPAVACLRGDRVPVKPHPSRRRRRRTLVPGFFCLSSAMASLTTAASEENWRPVPERVTPPG